MSQRSVEIDDLTPEAVWGDEPLEVRTLTETFMIRRIGPFDKRHHYQVWHAFKWGQQPLTQTNWRICANLAAAIQLMERYS